jgi:thiosulfate/3-mercaptopyruvate sulfurtransferase
MAPARGNFKVRALKALEINSMELYAIHRHYNVIDGRPASHFSGKQKFPANNRFGRIEGSINQPWEEYLQTDKSGLIYIDAEIQPSLLQKQMLTQEQPLILTCFGGTGGATNYFMFYINGYRNLRLHDAGIRHWNTLQLPLVQ